MNIADGTAHPLVQTPAIEANARISPDGKWIAYQSNESGTFEIYVQAFPTATRKWQASVGGGIGPEWAAGERELFYRNGSRMIAVSFLTGSEPVFGRPERLFEGDYSPSTPWLGSAYGIARDGRFVMITNESAPMTHLNLVQNWFEELKARVPVK